MQAGDRQWVELRVREILEKYQVFAYFGAVLAGLALGISAPNRTGVLSVLVWPALGMLLYVIFTQVPLAGFRRSVADGRFLVAIVGGNFLILPLIVWLLVQLVAEVPAIRLGVFMVLLVPCTDWFITFTQLGGGDTKRAILFSPFSLVFQIVLLPIYLWVFMGGEFVVGLARSQLLLAFVGLVLMPLLLAVLMQKRREQFATYWKMLPWLPVPLLAAVVFMVAASQVDIVRETLTTGLLVNLVFVFALFLFVAGLLGRIVAQLFRLGPTEGRVLAFSFGTRNSFVVLPVALALPAGLEFAAVVIVLQSLVELFGMIGYLWWVPKALFPAPAPQPR
jgi:arsenite transporter